MPNFKQHAKVGALAGAGLAIAVNLIQQSNRRQENPGQPFDFGELLLKAFIGSAFGAAAGVLPDILEPATSPRHRSVCHSLLAAGLVGRTVIKAQDSDLNQDQKELITVVGMGYLSHLLLDSGTPMGLPLVA